MNLPFTPDQFLSVFERYNQAVWPIQILLNILGLAAVVLAVKRYRSSDRIVATILAILWLWTGLAYHLAFFTSINPAAYAFAILTVLQGIVFLLYGVFNSRLRFQFRADAYGFAGAFLILYAMLIYPTLGYFLGHAYPRSPTFGLPCPTTIFTFGMLLWTERRLPKVVLLIPFLWTLIGSSAAVPLGIHEDIGLFVAGVGGTVLLFIRDWRTEGQIA